MPSPANDPALAARSIALDLLQAVLRRRSALDEALTADPRLAGLAARDRGFTRLLVATTLRHLGQIDALLRRCLARPLPARAAIVHDILRLGAAQLLFLRTPAHAAVDTAVRLAEVNGRGGLRGLVNAVLRRLAREGEAMLAAEDTARVATPAWLWDSWCAAYGEATARAVALAHLGEPPLDITPKDPSAAAELAGRLDAVLLPTGTIRRPLGGMVSDLPGYASGTWWIQDAAAALPARLLGDIAGRRVIDLAAAPGGKTAQLAAAGAAVTAVDMSAPRLALLRDNLVRLRLDAEVVQADAGVWRPERPADAVLLDAPCTATGTVRRHPDVPWLKRPEDVVRMAATQDRLLRAALDMVVPGGRLVYACCSLQPEEGPARVAALLAGGAPAVRDPVAPGEVGGLAELVTREGDVRTLPCHLSAEGGLDGFYIARLRRL